jgi:hypothetical protein
MLSRQLVIYFLLCMIAIFMVREFSISPESFSDTRNPIFLIFTFVLLTYTLFGYELYLKLKNASFNVSIWRKLMVSSVIVLIIASGLEIAYISELSPNLGRNPKNANGQIFSLPWLNHYTNTNYINFYTFLIYISSVTVSTILYRWIKR